MIRTVYAERLDGTVLIPVELGNGPIIEINRPTHNQDLWDYICLHLIRDHLWIEESYDYDPESRDFDVSYRQRTPRQVIHTLKRHRKPIPSELLIDSGDLDHSSNPTSPTPAIPSDIAIQATHTPGGPGPIKPGFLGLIVDKERFEVSREGSDEKVAFDRGKLAWAVFLRLLRSRDCFCPMDQLRCVWGDYGLESDPEDQTIRDK